MNRIPTYYNPKLYTLTAMIIGYALIDDFTANEQNAIGNWLMTIGQILEANCAIQQVFEERIIGHTININSNKCKNGGSPYMDNPPLFNEAVSKDYPSEDEIDYLKSVLDKIISKLDSMSKKN